MSKNVLKIVSDAMRDLNLEYGFVNYEKSPISYPYFVGDYTETEALNEDGLQESTFRLTGFSRDAWLTLENAMEKLEKYFDYVSGKTMVMADGSAVAIFYAGSLIVPTGDAELKRIQINLSVKEWKVN